MSAPKIVTVTRTICRIDPLLPSAVMMLAIFLSAAVPLSAGAQTPGQKAVGSARLKFTYHVCRNDTVRSVAELLGVSESDLRRWNHSAISGNRFKPGTQRAVYYAERAWAQESVGRPNDGSLVGGVNLDCDGDDRGSGWIINAQRVNMYGTPETVRAVRTAAKAYRNYFTSRGSRYVPLAVGNLSRREGGPLPPHASHQSGRDVDIGIIRVNGNTPGHFANASPSSMDNLRTWVMLKSFLDTGEVQFIFVHRDLKAELREYVERIYVADRRKQARYLEFFEGPLIQGDGEHSSHVHIRFRCPDNDRRCIP